MQTWRASDDDVRRAWAGANAGVGNNGLLMMMLAAYVIWRGAK